MGSFPSDEILSGVSYRSLIASKNSGGIAGRLPVFWSFLSFFPAAARDFSKVEFVVL
jgi:hypothetical protein